MHRIQVMHTSFDFTLEHFPLSLKLALFLLCLITPTWLHADSISGTIQDSSGAVIAQARVEITGGGLEQPIVLSSDGLGKFASPDLKPGTYSLRIMREGFEPLIKTVDLKGTLQLQLTLAIARQQVSITVSGKNLAFANSDPLYRQLRDIGLGQTYRLDNFTLSWDVATFHFQQGTLTVLNPVDGIETGAIFIGEGHFNLKPVLPADARELQRRTGAPEADEDFTEIVFRFTRQEWSKFIPAIGQQAGTTVRGGRRPQPLEGKDESAAGAPGRFYAILVTGRNHGQRGRRPYGRPLQSLASGIS